VSRDNVRCTLVQKDTSSSRGFVSKHRLDGRLLGTLFTYNSFIQSFHRYLGSFPATLIFVASATTLFIVYSDCKLDLKDQTSYNAPHVTLSPSRCKAIAR